VESSINQGTAKIQCPGCRECQGIFTDQEIRSLCDEGTWNRYERLQNVKENHNCLVTQCPFCKHPHVEVGNESSPDICCERCHQNYFHGNDPNILCHEHPRELSQSQMKFSPVVMAMAMVTATVRSRSQTRNCPSCSAPTEKSGECNQMRCQYCSAVSQFTSSLLLSVTLLTFVRIGVGSVVLSEQTRKKILIICIHSNLVTDFRMLCSSCGTLDNLPSPLSFPRQTRDRLCLHPHNDWCAPLLIFLCSQISLCFPLYSIRNDWYLLRF
jgi:hypothetical protein